ncbi:MATE family efflux transporter, partial [Vibrio owensii]|uniref:MATE family efflux transporter n=1 Tax=Vibrio owensii TaxID=696485 RepID=UPI003AAB1912
MATLLITIATTPFLSIIISHEDMRYFAVISVAESITKLLAVASLVSLSGDKLELYGVVLFAVSLFTFLAYFVICLMKYEECRRLNFSFDKALLKQMSSFTGWTMFGQFSTAVRVQAVTILVNQYFNPSTVAARAIAITIASKVNIFATNFNTGLYPSIIKNYANGYEEEFRSLVFNGSKLTFFLMWVFAFPLLIEMDTILNIWLPHNPEPAVLFSRLALLESIIFSISLPLATAARAPGKMRNYELILGSMQVS